MPRCGGGQRGALETSGAKGGKCPAGHCNNRADKGLFHSIHENALPIEDQQGIASFHRRSPRKGRTLQAIVKTAPGEVRSRPNLQSPFWYGKECQRRDRSP